MPTRTRMGAPDAPCHTWCTYTDAPRGAQHAPEAKEFREQDDPVIKEERLSRSADIPRNGSHANETAPRRSDGSEEISQRSQLQLQELEER
eukprot:2613320-Pyramimonas_sp.AAC.2